MRAKVTTRTVIVMIARTTRTPLDEKLKALTSASDELGKNLDELSSQHSELSEALKNAFKDSADEPARTSTT